MHRTSLATLGLPVGCGVNLTHCGVPMAWRRSHTTWDGRPSQGRQTTQAQYTCTAGCGVEVAITATEPA